jgi:hypothetical protein
VWALIRSIDYDHEPIHRRARDLLRDPALGPVMYWDLQNQNHCPDGDKYQATAWRTIPDYQGGEFFCLSAYGDRANDDSLSCPLYPLFISHSIDHTRLLYALHYSFTRLQASYSMVVFIPPHSCA